MSLSNLFQMSYDAALTHPFHPKAKGARVPDEFVFPTTVYSTTVNYTVYSDENGDADFGVVPNPFVGIVASSSGFTAPGMYIGGLDGVQNGPTPTQSFGGLLGQRIVPVAPFAGTWPLYPTDVWPLTAAPGPPGYPVGTSGIDYGVPAKHSGVYCPALSAEAMATYMSSWRLVGMGIRVRSLPSPQTQSGQFQCCTVPCPDVLSNPANSDLPGWLLTNGFPTYDRQKGYLQSSMIQYPASDMYMFAELTREGGLEWIGRHTGPKSTQFRGSSPTAPCETIQYLNAVDASAGVQTVVQATNLAAATSTLAGQPNTFQTYDEYGFTCSGWSSFFARFTGLPAAPAGTLVPCVNVEVVFHLEGQPAVDSAGGLVPNVAKGIYDHSYFTACCMKASAEPWFRRVIDYDRFSGRVVDSNAPLQVAMSGLLGSQRRQRISSKSKGLKRRFY